MDSSVDSSRRSYKSLQTISGDHLAAWAWKMREEKRVNKGRGENVKEKEEEEGGERELVSDDIHIIAPSYRYVRFSVFVFHVIF